MAGDGDNGKGAIIAAVIGAVALVIVAIIGANNSAQIKEREISATQTKEAVLIALASKNAGAVAGVTDTPYPATEVIASQTSTPTLPATVSIDPTSTPSPSQTVPTFPDLQPLVQTEPTDTPPGTMLRVGETWISNGLHVQLEKIEFLFGDEADLHFNFTNQSGRTINLYFNHTTHVTLKDDKGNIYTWDSVYEKNASIDHGETWSDEVYKGGNLSRAGYFVIQLEIPGIITAQWQY